MVKRSKKSKSKRVSLKQKYKVLKKVKDHHKKKAKEAKKSGLNKRKKVEKDPGIPNELPFKEQELKALEARRERAKEEIEQKKAARKERAKKRKLGELEDGNAPELANTELENETTSAENKKRARVGGNPDKAFFKELNKVIEASDVILEVVDARDPLGTRCIDMEKMVMKSGPEKRLVLLLNKIDLVPRESVEKWLLYLREELPAVAFKSSTQEQRSNLGWKYSKVAKAKDILQTSDCLGAETLIRLLKNYSRSHEIKKSITVGVIGLPNVGKSSVINSLKRSHVANVGSTPGLTRSMQEVHLDKNVKLLDCPGVVMLKSDESDASIALRNCKRIEKLDDPIAPVTEIVKCCTSSSLMTLYKIPSFESADEFLLNVANVRGRLKKGGILDVDAAARIVLHDWNEGKIPYFTMPPTRNQGAVLESQIVSQLGKEFDIDKAYNGESSFIGSLKSIDDFHPIEVPSSHPLSLDEKMLEDDSEPNAERKTQNIAAVDAAEDEPMKCEDGADESKEVTAARGQNEKLYKPMGILNPKLKRVEKKKKKKENKVHSMDEDYDFKVDYAKNGSAMDDIKEDGDDTASFGKIPMADVPFENEE